MSFSGAVPPANLPTFPVGACAGRARLMDPKPGDQQGITAARRVCLGCPVLAECREWMSTLTRKADPGGVIAATTLEERAGHDPDRKVCTRCWTALPRVAFTTNSRRGKVRLRPWCRTCSARYLTEWRATKDAEVAA